ncbi:S-fimbrial protein subunit SfaG [compost metagenome]
MQFSSFVRTLAIAGSMACSGAFAAGPQGGVINFTGRVLDTTCVVDAGSTNMNVRLPDIDKTQLAGSNSSAGITAFSIRVTGCDASPDAALVSARFIPDGNVNAAGNLVNSGTATNIAIQLLDKDKNAINIQTDQYLSAEPASGASIDLKYWARYFSELGNAGAGDVSAMANFELIYQ